MSLSEEDKRRIYEEEKARVEAREKAEREAKRGKLTFGKFTMGCLGLFIGVPIVLGVIGAIVGGPDKTAGKSDASSASAPRTASNVIEVQMGKRKVKAGIVDETVHAVAGVERRKSIGNQFVSERADGEFLIVRLVVRNDSKETRTIGASQMTILDAAGREFHTSSEGGTALVMSGDKSAEFLLTQVQPGLEKNISVVFDVPPGSKNLKLKIPSGGFGEPAIVPL